MSPHPGSAHAPMYGRDRRTTMVRGEEAFMARGKVRLFEARPRHAAASKAWRRAREARRPDGGFLAGLALGAGLAYLLAKIMPDLK